MVSSVAFLARRVLVEPAPGAGSPPAPPRLLRRALVVYGTRYGNTQRLAEALARGLGRVVGVGVDCLPVDRVAPGALGSYDLVAIGGPTERHNASAPVRAFLAALEGRDLRGLRGFAFDTRFRAPLSGSAAKVIQRRLERLGVGILLPSASGFVTPVADPEKEGMLAAPTEATFELLGERLGAALLR